MEMKRRSARRPPQPLGRISFLRGRLKRLLASLLAMAVFTPEPVWSDPVECGDSMVTVLGSTIENAERVCRAVDNSKGLFESCGLRQTQPLRVEVVEAVTHGAGASVLAVYRYSDEIVQVTALESLSSAIVADSPYSRLPVADVFDSLIVHELAHALLFQTMGDKQPCLAAHEYVAHTMQLAAMPRTTRKILLDLYPRTQAVDLDELNDVCYGLAPLRFGVDAWRHFTMPEHGCAFVREIISGRAQFLAPE